ncbi:hypothetical protein FV218_12285 [Methylobacterium sp. WL69]|uniref:hypothetical protein n=1 Tax=Methylobacterium sp. WL69 TaxID=2603893 RepID=UPI0011C9FEDF|nr:hypothetical protein [Methylobacterium sp. WL69]TXM72910.1 hypothetical protein FV218_12285 [Methylobacterium sp. WL69]
MSNDNTKSLNRQVRRPSLGFQEVQRRKKLHAVLRDVRTALDVAGPDADAQRLAVADLVAHAVIEVAILDRETDSEAQAGVYQSLLAVAIDCDDAPWEAIARWNRLAPTPIAAFSAAWNDHLDRAERNSESRHHHLKLVDLAEISAGLGLTRKKTREIFGDAKCSLPPVKVRAGRVSPEDRKWLRGVAGELGVSRERVVDVFIAHGRAGVDDLIVKQAAAEPSWWRAFGIASPKSGRPTDPDCFTLEVRKVAKQFRMAERTIWRKIKSIRAEGPIESEEWASDDMVVLCRVVEELAPKRHRRVYSRADTKIVVEWMTAVEGKAPTSDRMKKWRKRGLWQRKVSTARAWSLLQNICSNETEDSAIVPKIAFAFRGVSDVPAIGPFRNVEDGRSRDVSETAPEAEALADGR